MHGCPLECGMWEDLYNMGPLLALRNLQLNRTAERSAALTVEPVHTHHKVNTVVKLLVVLFRGEVGQV